MKYLQVIRLITFSIIVSFFISENCFGIDDNTNNHSPGGWLKLGRGAIINSALTIAPFFGKPYAAQVARQCVRNEIKAASFQCYMIDDILKNNRKLVEIMPSVERRAVSYGSVASSFFASLFFDTGILLFRSLRDLCTGSSLRDVTINGSVEILKSSVRACIIGGVVYGGIYVGDNMAIVLLDIAVDECTTGYLFVDYLLGDFLKGACVQRGASYASDMGMKYGGYVAACLASFLVDRII